MTKSRGEIPAYMDRIVQDPEIMVGKPVIRGTRIPVATVLSQLAAEPSLEELFAAYPRLTIEDVKATLAYARDTVEKRPKRIKRVDSSDMQRATA